MSEYIMPIDKPLTTSESANCSSSHMARPPSAVIPGLVPGIQRAADARVQFREAATLGERGTMDPGDKPLDDSRHARRGPRVRRRHHRAHATFLCGASLGGTMSWTSIVEVSWLLRPSSKVIS